MPRELEGKGVLIPEDIALLLADAADLKSAEA